ncbi:MAG: cysteine hydrolase [Syntrophorhabdaceae bacterium]|nr:cysteine hydrolase [Syntrophorhabdaceae bacterium]
MKPAVIIVDMLEDSYKKKGNGEREEEKIVPKVRDFLKDCRSLAIPIIFACDSFLEGDFIFKGRFKPTAIRGTEGANVYKALEPEPIDMILPKRRFSAFFKTDLDQTLRTLGVDTVAIGGLNTHVCVLATAFDAVCHDFYTIMLEDLCAAHKKEIHDNTVEAYRHFSIYPLFRVMTSREFLEEFKQTLNPGH